MYKHASSRQSSTLGGISLLYSTASIPEKTYEISAIKYGRKNIGVDGEMRTVKIHGTEGVKFGLEVVEIFNEPITYTTTESHSITDFNFDRNKDVSILDLYTSLPKRNKDTGVFGDLGIRIREKRQVLIGVIDSSGTYSFKQNFAGTKVRTTQINTAAAASGASGGTKLTFDDLTSVRVGDKVTCSSIPSTSTIKVASIDPDGDNLRELTLDGTVTIANEAYVSFERDRFYGINLVEELVSSPTGQDVDISQLGEKTPTCVLTQFKNPKLTIRNKGHANYNITHNNSTATSLSAGQDFDISHTGRANLDVGSNNNMYSSTTNRFNVSLTIVKAAASGKGWTSVDEIKFSSLKQALSSWSNSISRNNGGTKIKINNISVTEVSAAAPQTTITLAYSVNVQRWGGKDVVMEFDLNSISTYVA